MRLAAGLLALASMATAAAEPRAGHDMRGHMNDDPFNVMLKLDRLELRDAGAHSQLDWDADAWFGRDFNKLLLRTEGESSGAVESADLEALWARPFARWWEVVAGVRHEFEPRQSRSWLALGVTGIMPYQFHLQATAYAGEQGRTALQLESEYELLLTNRLILQPRAELNAYGKDDPLRGIGSGLSDVELGVRLRYEIRREIAPYVGVAWVNQLGRTADLTRAGGDDPRDLHLLVGVRAWY
jgi:copper resistance protein B